ncbi:MAG: MlaD family protein [Candidatus Cloacimonadaceae bacterium]|nr:MlaD family protein [Candidatus Cloacimonadota bacterium]MDY0319127.1 MlaD family protein [Candidatus Cloacimonadaceae bacterium]
MAKFYQHLRSTRIKTGIWTVLILIILVLGYLWLSNKISMKKQQYLRVLFTEVMGLETGDKIMFRGMEAGRVKSVQLHPEGIVVMGKISADIRVPVGSRFYIEDSIMGSKSLNILPAETTKYLNLQDIQRGDTPVSMMAMISQAKDMLSRLDTILRDIETEGGMIDLSEKLVRNTDATMTEARQGIAGLRAELSVMIGKVEEFTDTAGQIAQENRESLNSTLSLAPATFSRINSTLDSLQTLSANLNRSAVMIADGSGSAGKILNEDDLYQKLMISIDNLDALIADIKANPRKYIKFSVF